MKNKWIYGFVIIVILTSFISKPKPGVKLPKEYVKVMGGTYVTNPDSGKRKVMNEFYMSAFEVSNLKYRTFIGDISNNMNQEEIRLLLPDTSKFNMIKPQTEPLKKYYYSHSSFNHYPVVNISHYAATKYCEWLQEKIKQENPGYDVRVKLPSKEEWVWAAQGGRSHAMFPWTNYFLHDKKGNKLCHFKSVDDQLIYRNRQSGKPEIKDPLQGTNNFTFTAVVDSYKKNDFGLYNMCGNVSEMISDPGIGMGGSWNDYGGDVHIKAESGYDVASPMVGFRPIIIIKKIQ